MAATPNPINIRQVNGVYYFHDYHKTRIAGERNPKFESDVVSRMILDTKKSTNRHFNLSVQFFSKELNQVLPAILNATRQYTAVVVPSSKEGEHSPGLEAILESVTKAHHRLSVEARALNRHETIEKLATGGPREVHVHLDSVNVPDEDHVRGKRILLVDDITTTGHSFEGCKRILESAGARDIICLAIAKTADD
jgi:predicted amidophosphoribosyltransferase